MIGRHDGGMGSDQGTYTMERGCPLFISFASMCHFICLYNLYKSPNVWTAPKPSRIHQVETIPYPGLMHINVSLAKTFDVSRE